MPRRLFTALLPLVMACEGPLFGEEQVDEKWCTTTWMCDLNSSGVELASESGCEDGYLPAVCLYYGATDARGQYVYCHEEESFQDTCLYESVCNWDEDLGYFIVECTNQVYGMP